jgi:hypothetical protein
MTLGMTDIDTETADAAEEIRGTIMTDADPEDRKPWTVKGMPEWVMDTARKAAKARRMSMGEWLSEIIPRAASPDGQTDHGMPATTQLPAVVHPQENHSQPKVSQIAEIADVAKQLSEIQGLPESVLKEAHGLLRDKLKAARRN